MKYLKSVFLLIAICIFYFGCSDNPSAPEETEIDQVATPLSKVARFTSTSTLVAPIPPGPTTTDLPGGRTLTRGNKTEWSDAASDPRVTGKAFWTTNSLVNKYGRGITWGNCELFVDDPQDPNADPVGKWKITWNGVVSGNPANGDLYIKGIAKGVGVEGDVEGLTAKWFYTLDQINVGFYYTSKGFIK
jgi:hypothetical protein